MVRENAWHRHPLIVAACTALLGAIVAGAATIWAAHIQAPRDSDRSATPNIEGLRLGDDRMAPTSVRTADQDLPVIAVPPSQSDTAAFDETPTRPDQTGAVESNPAVSAAEPRPAQAITAKKDRVVPAAVAQTPEIGIIERICGSAVISIDFTFDTRNGNLPDAGGARLIQIGGCDRLSGTFNTTLPNSIASGKGSGRATERNLIFDYYLKDPSFSDEMRCSVSAYDIGTPTFFGTVKCSFRQKRIPEYQVRIVL